jgi:hypothetical protein
MWRALKKIILGRGGRQQELDSGAIRRTFSGDVEVVSWASVTEELPLPDDEITTPGKTFLESEERS